MNERCKTRHSEQITPLVMAICSGHAAVVSALVEAGADVELKSELAREGGQGLFWAPPPLLIAKSQEIMKLLLDAGANPNTVLSFMDPDMTTLLHAFVLCDEGVHMARLLLEAGADPSAINAEGHTPLDYALEHENLNMAALLKEWTGLDDSE